LFSCFSNTYSTARAYSSTDDKVCCTGSSVFGISKKVEKKEWKGRRVRMEVRRRKKANGKIMRQEFAKHSNSVDKESGVEVLCVSGVGQFA
jgi:hypothetical protein